MEKTKAIILRHIKYTDSSLIVDCLTEQFGRLSCIVSGVKGGKSRMKAGFFQPAQMMELVIYFKKGKDLQRLKEVSPYYHYDALPYEVVRSAVAQFTIELIMHAVTEPEEHLELFQFLEQSLRYIDRTEEQLKNFPVYFAWNLPAFLGFAPNLTDDHMPFFDLSQGVFTISDTGDRYCLDPELSRVLVRLLGSDFSQMHGLNISRQEREDLLDAALSYFNYHVEKFRPLKSPDIFKVIFSGAR